MVVGICDRGDNVVIVVSNWIYFNDEVKISDILEVIFVIIIEIV